MWTTGHECEYRTDPTSAWHFETRHPPIDTGTPGTTDAAGGVAVAALLAGFAASCLTQEDREFASDCRLSSTYQILRPLSDLSDTVDSSRNILESSMRIANTTTRLISKHRKRPPLLCSPSGIAPSRLSVPRLHLSIPIPLNTPHKRPVLQHPHELPSAHPRRF
jgi:hypothetical protein